MKLIYQPITLTLILASIIFTLGIGWGLPHSETWQSDSLAPYHPLIGLSQLFSFGYFHKYPLVHQLILAVLNIPVVMVAFAKSYGPQGFSIYQFIVNLQAPEYATALILIDRSVSVVMAVLIIYFIYLLSKELSDERVARYTAFLLCFNLTLNQFAHVAKVEVPYVFWATVSLHQLIKALKTYRTKHYILSALTACLSFGTKDQAYAIFILPFILYLFLPIIAMFSRSTKLIDHNLNRNLSIFTLSFGFGALLVENVLLNYSGLVKRFHHLTGDAGFRSVGYTLDVSGIIALFVDFNRSLIITAWGTPIYLSMVLGVLLLFYEHRKRPDLIFYNSIPLLASLSYYLFFIQVIRQVHDRFVLLPSILLTFYAGYFLARLSNKLKSYSPILSSATITAIGIYSLVLTSTINMNMLFDVRYSAERWMQKHIPKDSTIEYYSYLHYLPRFPVDVKPYRIKKGVLEIESRRPDYIVVSSLYYNRFVGSKQYKATVGRLNITKKTLRYRKSNFHEFFQKLFNQQLRYKEANRFNFRLAYYRRLSSIPESIIIYKRDTQ